jgi:hypothetical protein
MDALTTRLTAYENVLKKFFDNTSLENDISSVSFGRKNSRSYSLELEPRSKSSSQTGRKAVLTRPMKR